MAFFEFNLDNCKTYEAAESLAAKQYHFVTLSAGKAAAVTAEGSDVLGVLLNEPASGEAATILPIITGEKVKIVCGGTIAQDAYVTTDNTGKAVTAGSGDQVLGRMLSLNATSADVATIMLENRGVPFEIYNNL